MEKKLKYDLTPCGKSFGELMEQLKTIKPKKPRGVVRDYGKFMLALDGAYMRAAKKND